MLLLPEKAQSLAQIEESFGLTSKVDSLAYKKPSILY